MLKRRQTASEHFSVEIRNHTVNAGRVILTELAISDIIGRSRFDHQNKGLGNGANAGIFDFDCVGGATRCGMELRATFSDSRTSNHAGLGT